MIHIVVLGEPIAQARPCFGNGRVYDPKRSSDYKKYINLIAKSHHVERVMLGAVKMRLEVYKKTPSNYGKIRTKQAENKEIRPKGRPDIDNYLKSVQDALNGFIYADDSQIVDVIASKYYSTNPRIEIWFEEVPE
jgi:Holliday junction resolvase RusA-like endonuclease